MGIIVWIYTSLDNKSWFRHPSEEDKNALCVEKCTFLYNTYLNLFYSLILKPYFCNN